MDKHLDDVKRCTHLCIVWKDDIRISLINLKKCQVHTIMCTAHIRVQFRVYKLKLFPNFSLLTFIQLLIKPPNNSTTN